MGEHRDKKGPHGFSKLSLEHTWQASSLLQTCCHFLSWNLVGNVLPITSKLICYQTLPCGELRVIRPKPLTLAFIQGFMHSRSFMLDPSVFRPTTEQDESLTPPGVSSLWIGFQLSFHPPSLNDLHIPLWIPNFLPLKSSSGTLVSLPHCHILAHG